METIYLQLIGLIRKVIFWMWNILKSLKNISVHIYWLLLTGIMQLSLIIVFFGTLTVILLMTAGQITKFRLHTGMQKIMVWLQKIAIKCFIKWKKEMIDKFLYNF